jgi:hypothetical protein
MAKTKTKPQETEQTYFAMDIKMSGGMLLGTMMEPPSEQSWTMGEFFTQAPKMPIVVKIRDGYESAEAREFMSVPPIMSKRMYEVLKSAGVLNLQVFDATIQSQDHTVKLKDFLAFNLIGLVKAADMKKSRFSPHNSSREIDAWFDHLQLKDEIRTDLLMFRLAEYTSTIVVHESVRKAIEAAGIRHVYFEET